MSSDNRQLNLFNKLENTSTSDAPSLGNTRSVETGQKHTRNARREQLVNYKGGECERCGIILPYYAYDFHHRDPQAKSFPLSQRYMSSRWDRLLDEADKCHLLCACCHRIVHKERDINFLKSNPKVRQ